MPRRNSKHLTDPGIEKIGKAPKGKRIERFDAGVPGLCLRITDKGAKSWSAYYRLNGKHQRMTIGPWPGVGVGEARDRARQIKDQAKDGADPKAAREAERQEGQEDARNTFCDLAEKYIRRECMGKNSDGSPKLKRGWEIERIIRRELFPHWQDTLVTDLRKRDAVALILSHGPRDPLVRTYNVHAYQDEKHEALEKWAGHIRDLIEPPPENVVQLATAGEAQ